MRLGRSPLSLMFFHAALLWVGCGESPRSAASTSTGDTGPGSVRAAADNGGSRNWTGTYALRGSLQGTRQAAGTLEVEPLVAGGAMYESTRRRVQRIYPAYDGPFYAARLTVVQGSDTLRGTLTCAHGPAAAPPLVCDPTSPLPGLEDATLVAQPDNRAIMTGSHGEGVSVEYARFTWERG
jgi:hypothetical protein